MVNFGNSSAATHAIVPKIGYLHLFNWGKGFKQGQERACTRATPMTHTNAFPQTTLIPCVKTQH